MSQFLSTFGQIDSAPSPTSRSDNFPLYHPSTPGYPTSDPLPSHPDYQNWSPTAPPPTLPPSLQDESELDDLVSELVQCDDHYNQYADQIFSDVIFEITRLKFPALYTEIRRCAEEAPKLEQKLGRNNMTETLNNCGTFFTKAFDSALPTLDSLCDAKRYANCPDPLYGYRALDYPNPFWFEGAGEIWRRTSSGSTKVTIDNCKKVRRTAEQCLLDETKPNDYCFQLYQHAIMCEPGTNCPYLRLPMVRCTYFNDKIDYQALKNCIDLLPNVERCRSGFVPFDEDPNNDQQNAV